MPRVYERKFDWEEAAKLYQEGQSTVQLAARYGVTHRAVNRVLEMHGVERRPASPATSVRPTTLECVICKRWLPDSEFAHHPRNKARRFHHRQCRECGTKARQDYRERHKIPCEKCGKPRLPHSEKRRKGVRDSGLCLACYRETLRGKPVAV